MTEQLRSILLGTIGLDVAALIAVLLTFARDGLVADPAELRAAARFAVGVTLIQFAHFTEELFTGFHRRFPELLGLAPWPSSFFVSFNLTWLAIWALASWGLTLRSRAALLALWFVAVAGIGNGIAHPLLSAYVAGYFPGLVTSPVIGVAGYLLLQRLLKATRPAGVS